VENQNKVQAQDQDRSQTTRTDLDPSLDRDVLTNIQDANETTDQASSTKRDSQEDAHLNATSDDLAEGERDQ
jgi:hypothetical protein